jgi:hypothetical protein
LAGAQSDVPFRAAAVPATVHVSAAKLMTVEVINSIKKVKILFIVIMLVNIVLKEK